jgi:hypothetical protein
MGAVFGVAVTGVLFKAMENDKLAELLAASGGKLGASDRAEIRGLLSGSDAAEDKLSHLTPTVAEQIDRVVRDAFVYAFDGAMLLCMAVSLVGVLAALLVVGKTPRPQHTVGPTPESPAPGTGT